MTLSQAKKIYLALGGPADHGPAEWRDIHREFEAILAAKTDRSAGRIIDWWGCWDRQNTATAYARKVRAMYAKEEKHEDK